MPRVGDASVAGVGHGFPVAVDDTDLSQFRPTVETQERFDNHYVDSPAWTRREDG